MNDVAGNGVRNRRRRPKPLSKNARRKFYRYRLPELMREQAIQDAADEMMRSGRLEICDPSRRSPGTIMTEAVDKIIGKRG